VAYNYQGQRVGRPHVNYQGQRVGRPHVAIWAEPEIVLAAGLGSGTDDVRATAPGAGLPEAMIETLRWRLIAVPGRLVRHAGQLILRLPPGCRLLAEILARLRAFRR
jgi:hypothetical protein